MESFISLKVWTNHFGQMSGKLRKEIQFEVMKNASHFFLLQTFVLTCAFISPSLAALPCRQWSLHGFSIQRQHVPADVLLQPQRRLLPAVGSRGWWEGVQRHHLALDRRTGHVWQHCGGGGGLCLCLLTDVAAEAQLLPGGGRKCTQEIYFVCKWCKIAFTYTFPFIIFDESAWKSTSNPSMIY